MSSPVGWVHKMLAKLYGKNPRELEEQILYQRLLVEQRREKSRHARRLAQQRVKGTPSADLFAQVFNLNGERRRGE